MKTNAVCRRLMALLFASAFAASSQAATYVYVSNAADGDISAYALNETSGALTALPRVPAGKLVMPMAVSPDRRVLYAASRVAPYRAFAYRIDPASGALALIQATELPDSMVYISVDRTGKNLLSASFGAHLVTVNRIGADGAVVSPPIQTLPTARNAHAIVVGPDNRHVYVPSLASDLVMAWDFDPAKGLLAASTPPVSPSQPGVGPRHMVFSPDGRHAYVLGEMAGNITTFAVGQSDGALRALGEVSGVPVDAGLRRGVPHLPTGGPGGLIDPYADRDRSNDIFAADVHITPNGKFLYSSERRRSTISRYAIDPRTGLPTFLGTTKTETQPRGFAIDPSGRFLVAAGEKSDHVAVFTIDPADGALTPVGRYPGGAGANWVEIVKF